MLNDITIKQSTNQYEELRRQARQYENELDSKLLCFSKLVSREISARDDDTESESSPLIGASRDVFDRMSKEIECLLATLSDINNQMAQYCQQIPNTSAATYTLQRHREILHDYTNEFNKTSKNIEAQLNREQLLGAVIKHTGGAINKKNDLYMKENEHIKNSEILIDEQINVAMRTRENLIKQRNAFKAIQTQMTTLANRFPLINSLVHKISIKRRKDSIILGCVIAVCMTLLILYIF